MNKTKTGQPARAVNDKVTLRTTRKNFDIFCKQTAGFVKPLIDWKKKTAKKNSPNLGEFAAGVNYNPLKDQDTPKGYKRPELTPGFFGFYMEHSAGAYKFFCPLPLLLPAPKSTPPAKFPIGELLAFWDGLPKKSGGRVEIGEYIFEIEGEK